MKKMVLKNSAPMQWKGNQQKTAKEFIVKKSQQWAMRAEVGAEASKHRGRGNNPNSPWQHWNTKGDTQTDTTHQGVQKVEDRK